MRWRIHAPLCGLSHEPLLPACRQLTASPTTTRAEVASQANLSCVRSGTFSLRLSAAAKGPRQSSGEFALNQLHTAATNPP